MIALANADSRHIPLADQSVQCVITSPPYWGLRSYNTGDNKHMEIGCEPTPALYVASIVAVMRECWRVLKDDGVLWLNLGDSYNGSAKGYNGNGTWQDRSNTKQGTNSGLLGLMPTNVDGLKPKDLVGIPWRVAFALQDDGWYLRQDIIWSKPNPMPESVTDRCTKAHEYVFLLSKSARYYYDAEAIKESYKRDDYDFSDWNKRKEHGAIGGAMILGANQQQGIGISHDLGNGTGRNRRSVWTVATSPYSGAHFATFPPALVEPMVLAGTSQRGQCPHCGKAWERVVEKSGMTKRSAMNERGMSLYGSTNGNALNYSGGHDLPERESITIGWTQQCDCPAADHVPQIILDPFAGSGTVGEVCRKLGRDFIGLDLSATYLTENAMPRAMNTNTVASMATLPMFSITAP